MPGKVIVRRFCFAFYKNPLPIFRVTTFIIAEYGMFDNLTGSCRVVIVVDSVH